MQRPWLPGLACLWFESLQDLPVIVSDSTFTFFFKDAGFQDKVVIWKGQAIGRITGRIGATYVSLEPELLSLLAPRDPARVAAVPAIKALPEDGRQQRYSASEVAEAAHGLSRHMPAIMSFAPSYAAECWQWGDGCAALYKSQGLHLRKTAAFWLLRAFCLHALEHRLLLIFCIGWNAENATEEYRAQAASPLLRVRPEN